MKKYNKLLLLGDSITYGYGLIRECVDAAENGRFKGTYRLSDIAADPALIMGIAKENNAERLSSVMGRYISNINDVMNGIRHNNKDADVVFIMQYDPFEGISVFEPLWKLSENNVCALNRCIAEETGKQGYLFADAYTPFLGHTRELTFMDIFDVHPNENGHRAIFEAVLKTLENM